MHRDIEKIIKDLKERFIVCPMPIHWAEMHKILLKKNKQNVKIENPLILGGWCCSDKEKFDRFIHHLAIAQQSGILSEVINYLDALNDEDFLYSDELISGEPLNKTGVNDLLREHAEKVNETIFPALNILEEIQTINKEITDEDILYDLFIKNGFNQTNEPKVKRGKSLLIDLLVELGDVFDSQKSLTFGVEFLEDFCFEIFNLKREN